MESLNLPIWATAAIAILSGVGGWLINFYKEIKANKREDNTQDNAKLVAENQIAFDIYKDIIKNLMEDRERLQKHLIESEKEHMECRESHGQLSKEVDFLRSELAEIKTEFQEYRAKNPGS